MANLRTLLAIAVLIAVAMGVLAGAEDPGNHYPFAAGTIKKVDPSGQLLTILTPKGPQTFVLTERTYFYRGKDKLTVDKLQVGDAVKINYYTNETGQVVIRRLKVAPTPPAEASPTP